MSPMIIVLVLLLILTVVAYPGWGFSRSWDLGLAPMGGLGTLFVIVFVLWLLGVV